MTNGGQAPSLRVNHWGRTFVPGGGIALVPLPKDSYSRFPKKYVLYDFGESEAEMAIHFQPSDEHIRLRGGYVEVGSHRREGREKIGFDSTAGWMGYLSCGPSNPQPVAACTSASAAALALLLCLWPSRTCEMRGVLWVRRRREGQLLVKRFAVDPKRPYGPPSPSPPSPAAC